MQQAQSGLYCEKHVTLHQGSMTMRIGLPSQSSLQNLARDDNGFATLLGPMMMNKIRVHPEIGATHSGGSSSSSSEEEIVDTQTTGSLFADALIHGDPIAVAKNLLSQLDLSQSNRRVIQKKLQYAATLRPSSSEYIKTMTWLKHAFSFPWNQTTRMPVSLHDSDQNTWSELCLENPNGSLQEIRQYISTVQRTLDENIYGLDKVKEELMSYVCKRITNPNATDHVLALCGPNGVGKCLGKDVRVRMYDGSSVAVQNIRVHDTLMGDDNGPRKVQSVTQGEDVMYRVTHSHTGQMFQCNRDHILCLRFADNYKFQSKANVLKNCIRYYDLEAKKNVTVPVEPNLEQDLRNRVWKITVADFANLPPNVQKGFVGYAIPVDYPNSNVSVSPYLVGRWLGCATQSPRSARALADSICASALDTRGFLAYLRNQNLYRRKRIPSELMGNSLKVRLQVLDGIKGAWHVRQRKSKRPQYLSSSLTLSDDDEKEKEEEEPVSDTTGPIMMTIRSRELAYDLQDLLSSIGIVSRISPQSHRLGPRWRLMVRTWDRIPIIKSPIKVMEIGTGPYYGFTLDGNCRFLLASHVVTHNTRIANCLSKALDVPFRSVSLGTVADVSYFTGHGYTFHESEPGRIVQILEETQSRTSILYFDELDKIHQTEKGQAIQSFLTHLIDPSQNKQFHDTYLNGLDLDLSQILFVFSLNSEQSLDRTVRDRLKIIRIKEPTAEEKLQITRKFLVPEVCHNIGCQIDFSDELLMRIVRSQQHTTGLRSVKRVVENVVGKLNVVRLLEPQQRQLLSYYRPKFDDMVYAIMSEHDEKDDAILSMYV
jgi:DNA polymerase III delta prime subunit